LLLLIFIQVDRDRAKYFLDRAAEAGVTEAELFMGSLYMDGAGDEHNQKLAVRWGPIRNNLLVDFLQLYQLLKHPNHLQLSFGPNFVIVTDLFCFLVP
jgi:hypothetical protein